MIAAVLLAVVAVGATIVISAIISQVVFAALMAYAFLSAFGCGVYYAGRYQGENKQIEAPEEAEKKEDAVDKKDGKTENQTGEGGEVAEKGMSKWSAVKKGLICTGRLGKEGGLVLVSFLQHSPELLELFMGDTEADIDARAKGSEGRRTDAVGRAKSNVGRVG
eukprot:g10129.t1